MNAIPTTSPTDQVRAALERIAIVSQRWYLSEPLLFGAWTTHRVVPNPKARSLRTGRGQVEFNPDLIQGLGAKQLEELMRFEAVRILLKHPYERRKPNGPLAWEASNLALQECLHTDLPVPNAVDRFGPEAPRLKSFEFYYLALNTLDEEPHGDPGSDCGGDDPAQASRKGQLDLFDSQEDCAGQGAGQAEACGEPAPAGSAGEAPGEPNGREGAANLDTHFDQATGFSNTALWDKDTFLAERIDELIQEIEASDSWGSVPGSTREQILASLRPRLDYRRVLRAFRASVISTSRRLTRMKPSRRYGFEYMGSRRDFTTSLLFAVDVSGSVGSADLARAFSIVNRFFRYGIESIDVIWFDTQVRSQDPLSLRRARHEVSVEGRGGTDFQPVMDYLDEHRQYDGLLIFTDGIAPAPRRPKRNRRTRISWLFHNEARWRAHGKSLVERGMTSAFVLPD